LLARSLPLSHSGDTLVRVAVADLNPPVVLVPEFPAIARLPVSPCQRGQAVPSENNIEKLSKQ
jgi:hypothetical protein